MWASFMALRAKTLLAQPLPADLDKFMHSLLGNREMTITWRTYIDNMNETLMYKNNQR